MDIQKNSTDGFVELVFSPRWTYIATVRSFLQKFLAVTLENNKSADIISMSASELLENAVKYANREIIKISAEHVKKENKLLLNVENYSNEDNIKTLRAELAKVNTGDPQEMYLAKLKESALRSDGGSQLGFARIRFEANATLHFEIKGDLVRVTATFSI